MINCPWCGALGVWEEAPDRPADYCGHDPAELVCDKDLIEWHAAKHESFYANSGHGDAEWAAIANERVASAWAMLLARASAV